MITPIEFKDVIELIKVLGWPIVVGAALLGFRKSLVGFIEVLGRRLTKLSLFDVTVDFATIPRPWDDMPLLEKSELTGGDVSSTSIMILFDRISESTPLDFLVVDIKDGRFWLISRLFIFSLFLLYLRGLRCIVFVQTEGEHKRRFLGLANPNEVCVALARKYPWMEQALSNAYPILTKSISSDEAGKMIQGFINHEVMRKTTDPQLPGEWVQLGKQPAWEHTRWLNVERINDDLRYVFSNLDSSTFVDSPDMPARQRALAILRRQAPFVALLNNNREFKGLVDRQAFVTHVALRLGESYNEDHESALSSVTIKS